MRIPGARIKQDGTDRRGTRTRGRFLTVLGCAGALATAVMLVAPAAQADSDITIPGGAGAAGYKSDGEIFTVHDYVADGYSTVGYLYSYDTDSWHTCLNTNGASGAAKTCNYSFAEGSEVYYYVCTYKSSTGLDYVCSDDVYDYS